jgi:hypothetical protein
MSGRKRPQIEDDERRQAHQETKDITMGTIWENRLSKEDHQLLDKAFEDC